MTDYGKALANRYNRISGAHRYIVGFTRGSHVYYVTLTFSDLCDLLKEDRASSKRGGTFKLRVRVTTEQALRFIGTGKAVKLCNIEELTANAKYNKGENFERIITEKLTTEKWTKDSIPFYVKGDINVNGEEVQIKMDGAELTNEKTLTRAEALVRA